MKNKRPYILTIAGFDPSGGAGLVADVKTFEQLRCYGLSVCTANTVQNDTDFVDCHWMPLAQIQAQINVLFDRFTIDFVKIGIVQNWSTLQAIMNVLLERNPTVKIVLDPVLKSSSAYEFHGSEDLSDNLLSKLFLITPNYDEVQQLYEGLSIEETTARVTKQTNVLLKGGHRQDKKGYDQLLTQEGKVFGLQPKLKNVSPKHGSGCVLSSAITGYLALGYPLLKACYRGKKYTEQLLSSNPSLLGYHK